MGDMMDAGDSPSPPGLRPRQSHIGVLVVVVLACSMLTDSFAPLARLLVLAVGVGGLTLAARAWLDIRGHALGAATVALSLACAVVWVLAGPALLLGALSVGLVVSYLAWSYVWTRRP